MTHRNAPAVTASGVPANPFSTRHTRPGMLPPLDAAGVPIDPGRLLARLRPGGMAIEGPHGHGKSTLLHALLTEAAGAGRPTACVRVGSRGWVQRALSAIGLARPGAVVGIDGWERLPVAIARVLIMTATCRRATIVATTHGPTRMPVLMRCETSPEVLAALVALLPAHGGRIGAADIEEAFQLHGGNVREALYDLYDRFERRNRSLPVEAALPGLAPGRQSQERPERFLVRLPGP